MITPHFMELGVAYLLASIIPGPSIALVIRNGILYSRMASIQASLGVIAANALQSGAALLGLTFLNNNFIFLKTIKILCSLFLIYLGLKILLSKKTELIKSNDITSGIKDVKRLGYFLEGFFVNLLNPLAFSFFISIMTIIISPQESWVIKIGYWLELTFIGIMWFFGVAIIASSVRINLFSKRYRKILEVFTGVAFIFFGSKMFL